MCILAKVIFPVSYVGYASERDRANNEKGSEVIHQCYIPHAQWGGVRGKQRGRVVEGLSELR